jgi:hypothetical protein
LARQTASNAANHQKSGGWEVRLLRLPLEEVMIDIEHALQESYCDLAMVIQAFLKRGWEIVGIEYGDRRFNINSRLRVRRGEEEEVMSIDEIREWIEQDA